MQKGTITGEMKEPSQCPILCKKKMHSKVHLNLKWDPRNEGMNCPQFTFLSKIVSLIIGLQPTDGFCTKKALSSPKDRLLL